jgi:hypothetical protein
VNLYRRVRGTRRRRVTRRRSRRPATHASTRRAAWATRPIRSVTVASVTRMDGSLGGRRTEARISKSEHEAVEINPPNDCLNHPRIPVRGEEIDSPSRAFREVRREADFGPTRAHVDQWKSQQVSGARFKDNRPPAGLARMAPQFRRVPACRLTTHLAWEHGGWAYRRHRASDKSLRPLAVSSRAIFALSTGLPTMGCAMRDQSPRIPRP